MELSTGHVRQMFHQDHRKGQQWFSHHIKPIIHPTVGGKIEFVCYLIYGLIGTGLNVLIELFMLYIYELYYVLI